MEGENCRAGDGTPDAAGFEIATGDDTTRNTTASISPAPDQVTTIRNFNICCEGLVGYPGHPRRQVQPDQVEIVKSFLQRCRRLKAVQPLTTPISSTLKHQIERLPGVRYISTGAVIVAALELGLVVQQYCGARDALIGVNVRDVDRLMKGVRR